MNYKKSILSFFYLIICSTLLAQVNTEFANTTERKKLTKKLTQQIENTILLPLNESTYLQYEQAFWAMELMLYKPKKMEEVILNQLKIITSTPPQYQRSFFEMLYTNYLFKFNKEIESVWQNLANPKVKAMALEYLKASNIFPSTPIYTVDSAQLFFYQKEKNNDIKNLKEDDLLDRNFLTNQLVVISFQHSNRNIPGYLMIRTQQHKWLTNTNGSVFKVTQLARSITNMPYYLTNGNTPQGLYKLNGFAISDNKFIGPTTNLQMSMPFEISNDSFFNFKTNDPYLAYKKLLYPFSADEHLWQSFYAGKLGRSEVIAHGTTINPQYYKKEIYHPNTPSLGCLCSPELWNKKGIRTYSAQQQWIDALQKTGGGKGYLLVVEID
ncbi:MAG: hypothetical protein MUE72_05845 [Chitinophagaceae bacterium]|jgi:hypothetical protein|nr:hypothetical protein [Chitinophagaceae bacterium]